MNMKHFNEFGRKAHIAHLLDCNSNCHSKMIRLEAYNYLNDGSGSISTSEIEAFIQQAKDWADAHRTILFDVLVLGYGHSDDWRYDNEPQEQRKFLNYKTRRGAERAAKKLNGRVIEVYEY